MRVSMLRGGGFDTNTMQLMSSTSSTSGSDLQDRSIRLSAAGPGTVFQVGTEVLVVDPQGKLKSFPCDVQLVAVHAK